MSKRERKMWIYRQLFTVLFVAVISKVICTVAVTEFCADLEQTIRYTTGSTISITSPDYPDSTYTTDQECVINIELVDDQTIGFSIEQINLGDAGDRCIVDYIVLDPDGNPLPLRYIPICLVDSTGSSITYGHHLINQKGIQIKISSGSMRPGFHLNFTALPLHSLRSGDDVTEVSAESAPSGYIISQLSFNLNNPTFYSNNVYNRMRLTDIGGYSQIRLEFIFIGIGRSKSCQPSGDIFRLYEESGPTDSTQLYSCGDTDYTPPTQIFNNTSSSTSLIFQFQTDNIDRFRGFMVKYKLLPKIQTSPFPKTTTATKTTTKKPTTTEGLKETSATESVKHATVYNSTNYTYGHQSTVTLAAKGRSTEPGSPGITTNVMKYGGSTTLGVSAGVLVLIIIVNVVVCVIWRRSATTRQKEAQHVNMRQTDQSAISTCQHIDGYESLDLHGLQRDRDEETAHRYSTVNLTSQTEGTESSTEQRGSDVIPDTSVYMNSTPLYVNREVVSSN